MREESEVEEGPLQSDVSREEAIARMIELQSATGGNGFCGFTVSEISLLQATHALRHSSVSVTRPEPGSGEPDAGWA